MTAENELSNWGRWGAEDQLGALNLITPEIVKAAASLVKAGKVYSLSMPLDANGPQWPMRHATWRVTTYYNDPEKFGGADDVVTMHSHSGTHMDALCHAWYRDQLYNGYRASEFLGSRGSQRLSIDKAPFIVGRGVLLDVAAWKQVEHLSLGEGISRDDLDACAESQAVEIRPGDILLIRTGWLNVFHRDREQFYAGEPGLDMSTPGWLKANDIVAVGADNHGVEAMNKIPPDNIPFHRCVLRDLGIYLLEYLNLEQLSADRAFEFFFMVAPLQLTGGVGSPVNPVVVT